MYCTMAVALWSQWPHTPDKDWTELFPVVALMFPGATGYHASVMACKLTPGHALAMLFCCTT